MSAAEVIRAETIARLAHRDQFDKSGAPYIAHPQRVAAAVAGDTLQAAAWLHDVVEDTEFTAEDLLIAGVSTEVARIVLLLTRTDDVPPETYYARIRANPDARIVKLADIDDNCLPWRLDALDAPTRERLRVKYAKAREALRKPRFSEARDYPGLNGFTMRRTDGQA